MNHDFPILQNPHIPPRRLGRGEYHSQVLVHHIRFGLEITQAM